MSSSPRKGPITVPLTRHVRSTQGTTVAENDKTRHTLLRNRLLVKTAEQATASPVPVTNTINVYTAQVGVGQPPTSHNLLVDTGSANTWVGAQTTFAPTADAKDTGSKLAVQYRSSLVHGEEWTDTVTLGPDLVITGQGIGVASIALGFQNVDGVLGIGPVGLTQGTTTSGGTVPTVTDTAWNLGLLESKEIGIFFEPPTSASDANGELTFGGVNSARFTGSIHYVPITSTSTASNYVGIDQSISYGSSRTPILTQTSGIVDTGTTLITLPKEAFAAYTAATGAVTDQTTGFLKVTQAQYDAMQSLYFTIDNVEYEFTKNAQRWPRVLNTAVGGTADGIYLVVGNTGMSAGSGFDFTNGYVFLERYYTVYDSGSSRFGIAPTEFTFATSN
ncbi:acid protease [Irpex rosettiformis]|uniref:Acid protease n=1 Tax=Irpex rosettiformis TaxID=378272 RepID=A0ACB8U5J8_9APHY|nr:acid protease [Irpex rosettiformis]